MKANGRIPVIMVEEDNLPRAWEESLLWLWDKGVEISTEYDKQDEPKSRDCSMLIVIRKPLQEPRLHLILPTVGWETLEEYRLEVVEGKHPRDESHGESYTYHQRLFEYPGSRGLVDQIEFIVTKLIVAFYSRRAQAVTWDPERDTETDFPPCLQRIWCRVIPDSEEHLYLHMETNWRSRDAFGAAFPNMWVMIDLQRLIAERLSEQLGKEVSVGSYVDWSSSYHIYGKDIKKSGGSFYGFLRQIEQRPPEERFVRSDTEEVQEIFREVREKFQKE